MTRCLKPSTGLLLFFRTLSSPRCLQKHTSCSFTRLTSTLAKGHHIEYNWIRGVEALEEYAPGGYSGIDDLIRLITIVYIGTRFNFIDYF